MEAKLSTIEDKLAKTVRDRREQLKLTLRELAAKSGVSSSMISDIERGTKSPTISTLLALATALEMPISAFVDIATPMTNRVHVVRAGERPTSIDPINGAKRDQFGSSIAGSNVEFLRYVVPPRTSAGPFAAHANGTIEHLHLAAGRLRVVVGSNEVTLEAGDSCTCLTDVPHGFDNRESDVEAEIYLVIESARS